MSSPVRQSQLHVAPSSSSASSPSLSAVVDFPLLPCRRACKAAAGSHRHRRVLSLESRPCYYGRLAMISMARCGYAGWNRRLCPIEPFSLIQVMRRRCHCIPSAVALLPPRLWPRQGSNSPFSISYLLCRAFSCVA